MKYYLIALLLFVTQIGYAQKDIETLSQSKIDSLRGVHVDTIIWYHSYCGECFFKKTDAPIKYYTCRVQSGYDLSYNAILYKQQGNYYLLNFDCTDIIIKRKLDSCRSAPYFISIIPVLKERDKTIIEMNKKGVFLESMQIDGGFDDAYIYLNNKVHHVHINEEVDSDQTKIPKRNYWTNKEIKLVGYILSDVKIK